jgi:hypothetical protein
VSEKKSVLDKTRKELLNQGVAADEVRGQQYLDHIMDIKRRKNDAILKAIDDAEKPFLEELAAVEEEYAIFLKLAS